MKKLVLTAAIILSLVMGSYAQENAQNNKNGGFLNNGGLFRRGAVPEQQMRGEDAGLFLPTHNIDGNWDSEQEPEAVASLGSGALLLMGFGAAYAMSKRKKKD